jgi:hypothetical protein
MDCPARLRTHISATIVALCKPDRFPDVALEVLRMATLESTPYSRQEEGVLDRGAGTMHQDGYYISRRDIGSADCEHTLGPVRAQPMALRVRAGRVFLPDAHCLLTAGGSWGGARRNLQFASPTQAARCAAAGLTAASVLPAWQQALPLEKESAAASGNCDVKQVFFPGLFSPESLTIMAKTREHSVFENETMENTLQAAWLYIGKPWYIRRSIAKFAMLGLTCLYTALLRAEAEQWMFYSPAATAVNAAANASLRVGGSSGGTSTVVGLGHQYETALDSAFAKLPQESLLLLWESGSNAKALIAVDVLVLTICAVQLCRRAVCKVGSQPLSAKRQMRRLLGTDHGLIVAVGAPLLWVLTCVAHLLRLRRTYVLAACASLCIWYRFLFVLRALNATGPLVSMIEHIASSLASFMLVLTMGCVACAQAFWLMFSLVPLPPADGWAGDGDELAVRSELEPWSTIQMSLFTVFKLMLGESSTSAFDVAAYNEAVMMRWLFVLANIVVTIVLLNLVIAMVAEKYTAMQHNSRAEFLQNRVGILLSALDSMGGTERRHACAMMSWVQVVVPRRGEETLAKGWQVQMEKQQLAMQTHVDEVLGNVEARLVAQHSKQFNSTQVSIQTLEQSTRETQELLRHMSAAQVAQARSVHELQALCSAVLKQRAAPITEGDKAEAAAAEALARKY